MKDKLKLHDLLARLEVVMGHEDPETLLPDFLTEHGFERAEWITRMLVFAFWIGYCSASSRLGTRAEQMRSDANYTIFWMTSEK